MADRSPVRSDTIPPPVLGLNTRDPISEMDPRYALELENFFPANGAVELRNGYRKHVLTTTGGSFAHLAELVNNAGTRSLIGFTFGNQIYNASSAGSGTDIDGGLSLVYSEAYTVNFRGRLFAKGYSSSPGADILYTDGTTVTAAAFTGPGGDDKNLWRLATFKSRLYALQIDDASMWYGGFELITGALTQFDFQSVLTLGGKPWYIGSFAMTGGDITQEYFCVITEQGEVLLYGGDYPGASTWGIVGRYFIPAPVGRKSFFNWGSDILIITYDGLVSLRDYIGTPAGTEYVFVSDSISSVFREEVARIVDSSYHHFIQGMVYPKGQYLLVNFYVVGANTATQLVMNTRTRAWTKFTGQAAVCWTLFNNEIYWGGSDTVNGGFIAKADNGNFDENPASAAAALTRTIKLRHAFNYFGDRRNIKQSCSARPVVYMSEGLRLTMGADFDYSNTAATQVVTPDTSDTSYKLYRPEVGLQGQGHAISIRIDGTVTTKRMSLQATQVSYNQGGP